MEALEALVEDLTCDADEDDEPETRNVSWLREGTYEVPGCFHTNRVEVVRNGHVARLLISWLEESGSAVCNGGEECYRCVVEGEKYTVVWIRCGDAALVAFYRMVREGDEWVRRMILLTA